MFYGTAAAILFGFGCHFCRLADHNKTGKVKHYIEIESCV